MKTNNYILAFDTANESISIAVGIAVDDNMHVVASYEGETQRQSNTKLLPKIDELLKINNISTDQISCVAVGCGPGSFTGVRIALATAKGIATALNIPIIGINTLDAIAWRAWNKGKRNYLYVIADAMRKEIYPALYKLSKNKVERLSSNKVLKADIAANEAYELNGKCQNLSICGDALNKYFNYFSNLNILDKKLWTPSGKSLLLAAKDCFNNKTNPGYVLPVYTRLSDAEEGERLKLANNTTKNLISGVLDIKNNDNLIQYLPIEKNDVVDIAKIELEMMKSDAWNKDQIKEELHLLNRSWWVAKTNNKIIGYAAAMYTYDNMELLKIAVIENMQGRGIAKQLISNVADDMRNLGANKCCLEVRAENKKAINFYNNLGLNKISERKNYYSDGEDAIIMQGPLPIVKKDIAGMNLKTDANLQNKSISKPIIFSIESSCDETACAITADGKVISDVIASQVDFHKRFGGVVPEIASRKHIEAICGVADVCIENAKINWSDIDAVAVTYAPGLVGALVVGMAFAKGLSFGLNVPLIGINHLEGHMYANKLSNENIELPAVASLISGGNTMLVEIKDWGKYTTLGSSIDDAVGEAFDKIAKYLGLGYPGGPIISKLAKKGNPKAINFPRAMMHSKDLMFSLSGLKTAVITYIDKHQNDTNFNLEDLCASFEQAIIDVQVAKAEIAIKQTNAKTFMFGGGVAANPEIRDSYKQMCDKLNIKLVMAPFSACGDNAAMIGLVANDRYKQSKFFNLDADVLAHSSLDLEY